MAAHGADKDLCGAQRPNQPVGVTCKLRAGLGTDHPGVGRCKRHGGCTESHQQAASVEIARQECDRLGVPIQVDPGEALIREVWEAAGNVAFYRQLVQELPTHPEPDEYVVPDVKEEGLIDAPPDGERDAHWVRGTPGVYGPTYHQSGIPTGEAKPHILVQLYNDERKHLVSVAAAALKAGVEERRVRMAESDATMILGAQVKALVAMGLSDRLEEFRAQFVTALRRAGERPALGTASAG